MAGKRFVMGMFRDENQAVSAIEARGMVSDVISETEYED